MARLQHHVLGPLLGIGDVRTDKRIDFIGGARGTAALEKAVTGGQAAVAFSLHPVTIDDLPPHTARVPERFRGAHWTALPGGESTPEFVEQLRRLVDAFRRRHAAG